MVIIGDFRVLSIGCYVGNYPLPHLLTHSYWFAVLKNRVIEVAL